MPWLLFRSLEGAVLLKKNALKMSDLPTFLKKQARETSKCAMYFFGLSLSQLGAPSNTINPCIPRSFGSSWQSLIGCSFHLESLVAKKGGPVYARVLLSTHHSACLLFFFPNLWTRQYQQEAVDFFFKNAKKAVALV